MGRTDDPKNDRRYDNLNSISNVVKGVPVSGTVRCRKVQGVVQVLGGLWQVLFKCCLKG